jgi:hypothetical protein
MWRPDRSISRDKGFGVPSSNKPTQAPAGSDHVPGRQLSAAGTWLQRFSAADPRGSADPATGCALPPQTRCAARPLRTPCRRRLAGASAAGYPVTHLHCSISHACPQRDCSTAASEQSWEAGAPFSCIGWRRRPLRADAASVSARYPAGVGAVVSCFQRPNSFP